MASEKHVASGNQQRHRRWPWTALIAFTWLLGVWPWLASMNIGPGGAVAFAKKAPPPPKRFAFKIDPKTPLKDLLPAPPKVAELAAPWLVEDLAKVPVVAFQKPSALKLEPLPKEGEEKSEEELKRLFRRRDNMTDEMMKEIAHVIAKINHLNEKGTDHFLKVLVSSRSDLAGLPFVMGDACRLSKEQSRELLAAINAAHEVRLLREVEEDRALPKGFSERFELGRKRMIADMSEVKKSHERETPGAWIAALMQIAAPRELAMRQGLLNHLAGIDRPQATRALTRLAIFSFEEEMRKDALSALKMRRTKEDSDLLLEGLRYPWPAVARHAAEAMVKLERKDLVAQLVDFLDGPDPRAPALKESKGRKVPVVRELVRINHHHNCLLCHAPGNSPDVPLTRFGDSDEIVLGAVPHPGRELSSPSVGYRGDSPDILVRVDVTYLRQDFSLMQPVRNADPWPEMQRFDFLVRTRELSPKEATAYKEWLARQGPGYLSPNHQAALAALRSLTGRDAAPDSQAWRRALRKSE